MSGREGRGPCEGYRLSKRSVRSSFSLTATTEKIDRFPPAGGFPVLVELEAKRRGLMEAHTVAVVGDGGSFVWRTAKEICETRLARGKPVFEVLLLLDGDR